MRKDIEGALQCTKVASWRVGCAEFERAKFEGEAQFCRRHLRIDPQELIECWLPIPRAMAIADVEIVPQGLATNLYRHNPRAAAVNVGGNEEVIALIFSGLRRVTDLGLKNVPPSLLRIGLANVNLCARVGCFMLQREKQFVAGANKRRHEIRDQDGSAISKNALCLGAFRICLNDLPLAHVG